MLMVMLLLLLVLPAYQVHSSALTTGATHENNSNDNDGDDIGDN